MQSRLTRLAALPVLFCLALLSPVRADDLASARKLWMAGQRDTAVEQVEQALKRTPDDLPLRFTLGVMRMEQGQASAAKGIFTALTQDFPDLADPFNNLAVLHAAAGELDLAQSALEQALRLQPDHAQAQENLGDLLLRLAARAYDRAQKAHPAPSPQLATKMARTLNLIRELRTPTN